MRPETIAALAELGGPASAAEFTAGIRQAVAGRGTRLLPAELLQQETGYSLRYNDPQVLEAAHMLRERYAR